MSNIDDVRDEILRLIRGLRRLDETARNASDLLEAYLKDQEAKDDAAFPVVTDEMARIFDNVNAERIAYRDRADRLADALRPFAEAADRYDLGWDNQRDIATSRALGAEEETGVTVGMLRAAKEAIDADGESK